MKYYYLEYDSDAFGVKDKFLYKTQYDDAVNEKWNQRANELAYEKYLELYNKENEQLSIDSYWIDISKENYEYHLDEIKALDYL